MCYVAVSPSGQSYQAGSLPDLLTTLKTSAPDGSFTLYKRVAEVVKMPEVLVMPEKND